ncbi:hypothetical protein KL86DYS2_13219 [uncultured Dysgonomonas sp.]|uniref:Uncharacterized protein n=1 Tax=uncultured Dysgonomonas sp. TaxID=206096 RepID=A0A212K7R1_9BACT|nr:hypothetical protein KL86DYS2_13219 [uncultured Dysgonomonas sp.]
MRQLILQLYGYWEIIEEQNKYKDENRYYTKLNCRGKLASYRELFIETRRET